MAVVHMTQKAQTTKERMGSIDHLISDIKSLPLASNKNT
jgi:hypothetical protein